MMLVKKWIIGFIFSLFLLVGCQSEEAIPDGYYSYEQSEVEQALSLVNFEPEVPQFVPIPVEFIISDPYTIEGTTKEALDISFYSRDNDLLTYQVVEGSDQWPFEGEEIKLEQNVTAHYLDNDFAKTLVWQKEGLSYKLEFRSSVIGKDDPAKFITKDDLVRVAQSFQS